MPSKTTASLPPRRLFWLWLGCCFLGMGCTVPRNEPFPLNEEQVLYFPAVTYKDLQGEIASRCVSCHNADKMEGNYSVTSYANLLKQGSDSTPNAIAGDKNSLLLTVLKSDSSVEAHRVDDAWKAKLERWIVENKLAYQRGKAHPSDIHLPTAKGFHGKLIADEGWNFKTCASCHGDDLAGGGSTVSCLSCHNTQTQDGCSSCHQVKPNAQAVFQGTKVASRQSLGDVHQAHFRNRWMAALACKDCHKTPTSLRSEGHLDGKVQVALGSRAQANGSTPTWNANQRTCTNTYCHNSGMKDATAAEPGWKAPSEAMSCTTCHGNPPTTLKNGKPHPTDKQCSNCHKNVKEDGTTFNDPTLHINGKVESSLPTACNACHGSDENAAPPKSLTGRTSTDDIAVGAHQIHLKGTTRNSAFACSACHIVPKKTESEGHLDSSPNAEVIFQGLATRHNLKPTWERTTKTCSNVYCHGGSLNGGSQTKPVWTQIDGKQVTCGSCHGNPPRKVRSGASHTASKDCYRCHSSMAPDGTIKTPSLHINGRVDL